MISNVFYNQRGYSLILLSFFISLIIISGGIYYLNTKNSPSNPQTPAQSASPVPSVSPIPTEPTRSNTHNYPKYGHASDYSWVSGKIEGNNLEGGCIYLVFSETENNEDNFFGRITINPQQLVKDKNFKQGDFVALKGKVGESKFSMACPPQLYETKEILMQ